jgi:branched-chain amino acid aminotransferase
VVEKTPKNPFSDRMAKTPELIWHNGKLVPWRDATVHVLAHSLHYGSAVFEGIRAYVTKAGTKIFRLQAHVRRLYDSARIYRIEVPYTPEQITAACREVLNANQLAAGYLRPLVYRGAGGVGVMPASDVPIEVAIAALDWQGHLGADVKVSGVTACVSSWHRVAPNTVPALAKCAGNYASSILIVMEAKRDGYDAAIALDATGHVSEGSGENVFLVHGGVLRTPPLASSVLGGITRDSVLTLAHDAGIPVREEPIPRELLYMADEAFYAGTAAEITPIRAIDKLPVGDGKRGPVTKALQTLFFGLFTGETHDRHGWLE